MTTPSFRDVEQISALLDGKLTREEAARLQLRIAADPELASIYRQLSQTRTLLRKLPARRAPRNFTLTPNMAGVKAPTPRSFPLFRLASALASLLLMLSFAANGVGRLAANPPAAAPAYGMGGGEGLTAGQSVDLEAPSPETRPRSGGGGQEEPAAPSALAPSVATQDSPHQPDEEKRNLAAEPTLSAAEPTFSAQEMPAAKMGGEEAQAQDALQSLPREPFQVPGWLQLVLLGVALLAGGAAWFVNWQAQARFVQKNKK